MPRGGGRGVFTLRGDTHEDRGRQDPDTSSLFVYDGCPAVSVSQQQTGRLPQRHFLRNGQYGVRHQVACRKVENVLSGCSHHERIPLLGIPGTPSSPAAADGTGQPWRKKSRHGRTPSVFNHAGILVNGPPGTTG